MNLLNYYTRQNDINIKENEENYVIELLAPARKAEDFNIEVKGDHIIIESEKETTFSFTSFKKSFLLPEQIDKEKISAEYKAGVLIIEIPKSEIAKEKQIIKVKESN